MPIPIEDEGLPPLGGDNPANSPVHVGEVPTSLEDNRSADALECASIKWNVARIVRLSSGRYALLTHYREGALDLIKMGTIEEIAPYIPTAQQCEPPVRSAPVTRTTKGGTADLLADLGL